MDISDDHKTVKLTEESLQSTTGTCQIRLHSNAVVFRLDMPGEFSVKSPFLDTKPNLHLHKGCDYVVFCNYRGKYWFVLIELKSKVPAGAITQLSYSSVFIRYLRELIFLHDGHGDSYGLASILFSNRLPNKTIRTQVRSGYWAGVRTSDPNFGLTYYRIQSSPIHLDKMLDFELESRSDFETSLFNRNRCRPDKDKHRIEG